MKFLFGSLATIIGLVSYVPYVRDILKGKTKPHAFSWLLWSGMAAIVFVAQYVSGAGAGAWVTLTAALACLGIGCLALVYGQRNFVASDWIALIFAIVAVVLWQITEQPLLTIILLCIADLLAFFPSYRKLVQFPHEETLSLYLLAAIKFAISLFAIESYTLITMLYPMYLIVANTAFVVTGVILRRLSRR